MKTLRLPKNDMQDIKRKLQSLCYLFKAPIQKRLNGTGLFLHLGLKWIKYRPRQTLLWTVKDGLRGPTLLRKRSQGSVGGFPPCSSLHGLSQAVGFGLVEKHNAQ